MIHSYRSVADQITWCGLFVSHIYPEPGSATLAVMSTGCVDCYDNCVLWNLLDRERREFNDR